MDKAVIFKLTGLLVGSFIVTTVIMYFLYPYLNEEGYQEAVAEAKVEAEALTPAANTSNENTFEVLKRDPIIIHKDTCRTTNYDTILLAAIDSLKQVNMEYEQRIAELVEEVSEAKIASQTIPVAQNNTVNNSVNSAAGRVADAASTELENEEFFERVKSLLNLDEEELAPIVAKLNNDEVVRLYRGGGTIQREKLLRSLKPDRAASIMKEIML